MVNSPCKNCTYRHIGCHSNCLEYIGYKQQLELQKSFSSVNAEINNYTKDLSIKLSHLYYNGKLRKK